MRNTDQLTNEIESANEEARRLDHQRAVRMERQAAVDLLVFMAIAVLLVLIARMLTA